MEYFKISDTISMLHFDIGAYWRIAVFEEEWRAYISLFTSQMRCARAFIADAAMPAWVMRVDD